MYQLVISMNRECGLNLGLLMATAFLLGLTKCQTCKNTICKRGDLERLTNEISGKISSMENEFGKITAVISEMRDEVSELSGKISMMQSEMTKQHLQENKSMVDKCASNQSKGKEDALKPHIVLIIADALGYNDIGFRNSKFLTPILDELSKEGIRLDNYYVDAMPTAFRASLMTGRYQPNTGAMSIIPVATEHCIPHRDLNLPERLQNAGYSTYFIGKWHMGYSKPSCLPRSRGFDYFYGSYTGEWKDHFNHILEGCVRKGNATTIGKAYCLYRGRKIRDCAGRCWSKDFHYSGIDLNENEAPVLDSYGEFGADLLTKKATETIENHNHERRMFMTIAYDTKSPDATGEYRNKITQIPDGKLGVENIPRKNVAAMVNAIDTGVGKIIQKLKETGMWEDTVLLFTNDRGGHTKSNNNWPLRGSAFNFFEGGIRGIGIVAGPVTKKAKMYNNSNSQLYHVADWYKTFLDLAGANVGDSGADSHDIWSSISLDTTSPRDEILHSMNPVMPKLGEPLYRDTFDSSIHSVLRMGDYKLFTGRTFSIGGFTGWMAPVEYPELETIEPDLNDTSNVHLYNIKSDPLEKNDLSTKLISKVKEMLDRLAELQEDTKAEPYPCPDPRGRPVLVRKGATPDEDVYAWKPWL
ncbi:unnamed protein product [Owenia fusiformis]|uniref:Uncharacterized protein n=1 Tax=Owenia fusiformis TaxID=6347 RepID=A0A8J1USA6_OWEFU|nr:unnamed protein product [Owenia fusiformis]